MKDGDREKLEALRGILVEMSESLTVKVTTGAPMPLNNIVQHFYRHMTEEYATVLDRAITQIYGEKK